MLKAEGIRKIPMSFVLGFWRSGTTLLQNTLDANPLLVAPAEPAFLLMLYPRFAHIKHWTQKDVTELIRVLYDERFLTKMWAIDKKVFTDQLISYLPLLDFALVCKIIFYHMKKDKKEVKMFFNKRPINWLFMPKLLALFPEAKFIHLVRDPRDVLHSHIKTFKSKNSLFVALHWLNCNLVIEEQKQKMPDRFYTILYEDFVTDSEKKLKELCDFLNIEYSDSMLINPFPEKIKQFGNGEAILTSVNRIHQNLMSPINTSNLGKWKEGLNNDEKIIAENVCGDFSKENYGYDIPGHSNESISFTRFIRAKILFTLWKAFTLFRYRTYKLNLYYSRSKDYKTK